MKSDQNRRTPPWLFKFLQEFLRVKFKLDVAATKQNALCPKFYTVKENGLVQPYVDGSFGNPPFKPFKLWIQHAFEESLRTQNRVVLIGPAGGSQTWFHKYARRGTVYAPDERLVFFSSDKGLPTQGAREDSMVYAFGQGFWNPRPGVQFLMKQLPVRGMVVTS